MLWRYLDLGNPVADHPFNAGLVYWLLGLPGLTGGSVWRDITGRTAGGTLVGADAKWAGVAPDNYRAVATGATGSLSLPAKNTSLVPAVGYAVADWSFWYRATAYPGNYVKAATLSSGGVDLLWLYGEFDGMRANFGRAQWGNSPAAIGANVAVFDGNWHHLRMRVKALGTFSFNTRIEFWIDGALAAVGTDGYELNANYIDGGTVISGTEVASLRVVAGRWEPDYDGPGQARRGYPDLLRRWSWRTWLAGAGGGGGPVTVDGSGVVAGGCSVVGAGSVILGVGPLLTAATAATPAAVAALAAAGGASAGVAPPAAPSVITTTSPTITPAAAVAADAAVLFSGSGVIVGSVTVEPAVVVMIMAVGSTIGVSVVIGSAGASLIVDGAAVAGGGSALDAVPTPIHAGSGVGIGSAAASAGPLLTLAAGSVVAGGAALLTDPSAALAGSGVANGSSAASVAVSFVLVGGGVAGCLGAPVPGGRVVLTADGMAAGYATVGGSISSAPVVTEVVFTQDVWTEYTFTATVYSNYTFG